MIRRIFKSQELIKYCFLIFFTILLFNQNICAQTTGKLTGRIIDSNGESLIGANILVEGTSIGAATDLEGYYVILNLRSGIYNIRFDYIGYQAKIVENVQLSADKTTQLDAILNVEAFEGEEITVTAEKPLVEFNETSSISTITSEKMEALPIQNLEEIINLQAGVVDGHFRGGRIGEVQYQVDGVTVNNPYDNSSTLQLDRSIIQEVQVISGTFDAKYGQAMSGVVNAVLKTGSDKFEWSGEFYGGDFYTSDEKRYPFNNEIDAIGIQNYQLTLGGPTPIPNTTFFISGRHYVNNGYLFGERIFMPTDTNNFETGSFYPTGDFKTVPMQWKKEWSGQVKITNQSISNVQLSYQLILNNLEAQKYNHSFYLNPEGIKTQNTISLTQGIDMTHTLSQTMFYKLSLRQNYFEYSDYVYKSVFDRRYIEAGKPQSEANFALGAVVQGVDLDRFEQKTDSKIIKLDFTWQANRSNLIESGFEYQWSEMSFGSPGYLASTTIAGTQVLQPRFGTEPEDPKVESYDPLQFAYYLQDRYEWRNFVLRGGLRFELFDAQSDIPSDLQNPANAISGAPESKPQNTTVKTAIAPRLGFSFPLSSLSSIYFSYGHFYQMPGLGDLYNNSNYLVLNELQEGGIDYGIMGNPDLKPEKTVQYEFGLKQGLTSFLGLELTLFYKDIRDLLGVEFVSTYAAADYARFTNVDFGSVYGFTVALDQRPVGPISTTLDYTMQFTNGNSSDSRETANRAAAGEDPRPRDIPFNWDQRHTLNASAIYSVVDEYSLSTIIRFGSGQPYTPLTGTGGFGADLETNSGRKNTFALVDIRFEKFFEIGPAKMSAFMRISNLLNEHDVNGFVFAGTGSPDYTIIPAANRSQLIDPSRFHEPRRLEFGITFRNK